MIEAGGGFCFSPKTCQMCPASPLTEADDLERDGAIKTLLSGAKDDPLSSASDLGDQFVIAKLSQQAGRTRCLVVIRRCVWVGTFKLVRRIAVVARGPTVARRNPQRRFQNASGAKPFRGVRKDFGDALSANSDDSDHCRTRPPQ